MNKTWNYSKTSNEPDLKNHRLITQLVTMFGENAAYDLVETILKKNNRNLNKTNAKIEEFLEDK